MYPLNTHRYLVLPGLIRGRHRRVWDPDHHAQFHYGTPILEIPRISAPSAGRPSLSPCPRGRRAKSLAEREEGEGGATAPAVSSMPPRDLGLFPRTTAPRCGARGGALPRDLGVGRKREGEGLEREREKGKREARHHQMILSQLDGLIQQRQMMELDPLSSPAEQPHNELLQHHQIDHCPDVTCLCHQKHCQYCSGEQSTRLAEEWPASDRHRPEVSPQVAVVLLPAPSRTAAGSSAPATERDPTHMHPLSYRRGPQPLLGHPVDPSSPVGHGR